MQVPLLDYFTDPVLRAPTIGAMLMCLAASLVGVIVFLRKQSLIGEALSHASYPGVIVGVIAAAALSFDANDEMAVALSILAGAFFSALAGYGVISLLESKFKIRSDSALCFVLSSFFGIGLALASDVQFSHPALYRNVIIYFYGQAATMTDVHILVYGLLSLLIAVTVLFFYKELKVMTFDRAFAKSIGIKTQWIDLIVFILVVLAVVVGIRSVGVVLMSAMLIAPAAAARQFTNRMSIMLALAALFGLLSGFLGNVLSLELTAYFSQSTTSPRFALPTGPMIVLVAAAIALFSLLFAPERGVIMRCLRIFRFHRQCLEENILKSMWRYGNDKVFTLSELAKSQNVSAISLSFAIVPLKRSGWISKTSSGMYALTQLGRQWAANIVRLHRLWEVYLVDYLGVGAEKVHRSAEEMEHIITPELERELTLLLKDPKQDPHRQPIPSKEEI